MKNKKYYTARSLAEDCAPYLNEHGEKMLFRFRSIWKLATNDWKLKRVSFKRYETAKKLYYAVRRAWKYKDLSLEFDSRFSEDLAKYYSQKEDEELIKINNLCKVLNLRCVCSTWAHIRTSNDESEII